MGELIIFAAIMCVVFGAPTGALIANSEWLPLTDLYGIDSTEGKISEGSYRLVRCLSHGISLGVSVELYPDGLWLRPGFPVRVFTRGVLIPWGKISSRGMPDNFDTGVVMEFEEWPCVMEVGGAPGVAILEKLITKLSAV